MASLKKYCFLRLIYDVNQPKMENLKFYRMFLFEGWKNLVFSRFHDNLHCLIPPLDFVVLFFF